MKNPPSAIISTGDYRTIGAVLGAMAAAHVLCAAPCLGSVAFTEFASCLRKDFTLLSYCVLVLGSGERRGCCGDGTLYVHRLNREFSGGFSRHAVSWAGLGDGWEYCDNCSPSTVGVDVPSVCKGSYVHSDSSLAYFAIGVG
ncbi:hypothetical protein [Desulfosporosinus sp. FKA]|uniref:hypothetical protein n=1 Tax=Desulfosporosinus sp. FKA TaxID=1969834 RepID=UPI001124DA82|nr:hypothetical protein [Desulfosporosinus sp. FKA]